MAELQYQFLLTLGQVLNDGFMYDVYTAKTGTNTIRGMGVWGRVVLDEKGNICPEGEETILNNRIYYF